MCCFSAGTQAGNLFPVKPGRSYTWHFSTRGLPPAALLQTVVGSYPTFSPLPLLPSPLNKKEDTGGGYFLWHFPSPSAPLLLRQMAGRYPAGYPVLPGLSSLLQERQPSPAAGKDSEHLV